MIKEAANSSEAIFGLFNKKMNQTLFAENKEYFLKMSLFYINIYTNIVDRKYNDYECSAQIPSEI
jgi:hypothetical protein